MTRKQAKPVRPKDFKPSMRDEAVAAKTGKTWSEWFAILDGEGCAKMTHKAIVAVLAKKYDVAPWWQQMVAVTYEKVRGLRELYETPKGYQAGGSRVVNVPVGQVFAAWEKAALRKKWLEQPVVIRKSTPDKSLRITWEEDGSHVSVELYVKGASKTQISLSHTKLADQQAAMRMKAFWKERLDELRTSLEGQTV